MAAWRQPDIDAGRPGPPKAGRFLNRGTDSQGIDRPDLGHGGETIALITVPGKGQQPAGETSDLLVHDPAYGQEGPRGFLKEATLANQIFDPTKRTLSPALPMTGPWFLSKPRICFSRLHFTVTKYARLSHIARTP